MSVQMRKNMSAIVQPYGLTHSHAIYLIALHLQDGQTLVGLSRFLDLDTANTNRVIKVLREKEFIYDDRESESSKKYRIYLTEKGHSLAKAVINRLKEVNDKKGHLAGDELILRAAECIGECFGVPGESNCFRIGGDEFAAIVKRISRDEIDRRLAWFTERQKETGMSVAAGLAYAEEIGETDFRELFLKADRNMYSDKMRAHGEMDKNKNRT